MKNYYKNLTIQSTLLAILAVIAWFYIYNRYYDSTLAILGLILLIFVFTVLILLQFTRKQSLKLLGTIFRSFIYALSIGIIVYSSYELFYGDLLTFVGEMSSILIYVLALLTVALLNRSLDSESKPIKILISGKKKLIAEIALVIIVVVSLLIGIPTSEIVCETVGGDWVPYGASVGALMGCGFNKTSDGGKSCYSSSECSLNCVTGIGSDVLSQQGECQSYHIYLTRKRIFLTSPGVAVEKLNAY